MPLDMKVRREARKSAIITVFGEAVAVTYRPNTQTLASIERITLAERAASAGDTNGEDIIDIFAQQFLDTVTEWDVTDGGAPVPLTKEGLAHCDMETLNAIITAIREVESPKPLKPARS